MIFDVFKSFTLSKSFDAFLLKCHHNHHKHHKTKLKHGNPSSEIILNLESFDCRIVGLAEKDVLQK